MTFAMTVSDKLTMELTVANPSGTESLSFENCLHTYFTIGDIAEVEITDSREQRASTGWAT